MNAMQYQRMVHNGNSKITNNSCDGKCSCCGSCCSDIIPLTDAEVLALRKFVAKHKYKPNTKITAISTAVYDMTCPFLGKDNKCEIYGNRPEICRLWTCYEANPATQKDCPPEVYKKFCEFYLRNPVSRSMRKEIFGQAVPFD